MRWTPSSLPRLALCLGPAALPHAEEMSEDMRLGKAKHEHMERVNNGASPLDSLQEAPADLRAAVAELDVEALPLGKGLSEVALALHLERSTSRFLGKGMTREEVREALEPGEMGMILDWVSVDDSGTLWVVDWKTGAAEHLAPASENLQLLTYCAAALLCPRWGAQEVRGALVRVDRDPPHWERTEPMDALDVAAIIARLQKLLDRAEDARANQEVEGKLPRLHVGQQCAWCPSRRFCPAQVSQVRQLMSWPVDPASLTPEEAGQAYQRVLSGLSLLKRMKEDLEGLAHQVPLPMPDGKVLAWEEETSGSIDPGLAAPVLTQLYGPELVEASTKRGKDTMPWDLLKAELAAKVLPRLRDLEAQGRLAGKPTKAGLLKKVRMALEQAGAVKWKTYAVPRVIEAPKVLQSNNEVEQEHA